MKLLFLAPYPPFPPRGGGQQRMYQFIRNVARDHDVWLLTFSPGAAATAALGELRTVCEVRVVPQPAHAPRRRLRTLLFSAQPDMALRGQSSEYARALAELLRAIPFDVVQAESIEMAQYGAQRAGARPLFVYDAFNAEFVIQQRAFATDVRRLPKLPVAAYSLVQWQKLRRYERRLAQRFGGALAVSEGDAATLGALAPALRLGVVPNGVDTAFFQPGPNPQSRAQAATILFTGTLDYRANVDAVRWFVAEVLPRIRRELPDARLVVVGRNPVPAIQALATEPGVEIAGEVADVRPWFDAAAAYVVPMRIGGGVRLKVLEAMAMGKPVVATTMGAEGIAGLRAGEHALVADAPTDYAAQVVAVLRDPALSARLGTAGRALVSERYDWRAIVPLMTELWGEWRSENLEPRRRRT